ncbi:YeiH family protein [Paucibacter sp. R3-3]|uniref:YeiH family protein n=1 Tax=Roseateles agri TaxID=3098619 RepID=A0ABU5DHG6_9BURK|nr:YeiH family protein [Paucibacter sp. R3-3]MDY0745730.1 YeiH family protein [Paucibacter sp. R3-3]
MRSSNPISATQQFILPAAGLLPGLALTGALACAAIELGRNPWLQAHGIGALTVAIALGMLVGNTVYGRFAAASAQGVAFSKQNLLRLGVVLYGLRLSFRDIAQVGFGGVLIDATVVCSTLALAWFAGTRLFGLDRKTVLLIGVGSSFCGAAAVMATEPVVRGRPEQVTVAVSTVVVFGTLAIFLYPLLYPWLAITPHAYGLFAGSTIHEVAQVVAAGNAVGSDAGNTAVIAKMVRVMMLAPFLVALSAGMSRVRGNTGPSRITMPWFAFGFIAVAGLNSLALLPKPAIAIATDIDNAMLAMAMAALGLTTHFSAIRQAGLKPLALAGLLFAWLIAGGLAINACIDALF